MAVKEKPYRATSLSGAQREVRCLRKQLKHVTALFEECHKDRLLMAKLAADGPAFDDPLTASLAKVRRDELLKKWLRLKPDGSPL